MMVEMMEYVSYLGLVQSYNDGMGYRLDMYL